MSDMLQGAIQLAIQEQTYVGHFLFWYHFRSCVSSSGGAYKNQEPIRFCTNAMPKTNGQRAYQPSTFTQKNVAKSTLLQGSPESDNAGL